jgi:hypothetical protein
MRFGIMDRRGGSISPLISDLPGSSSATSNALASFLLGEMNSAGIQVSDKIPSRASGAFYAQDNRRVSDRLTISMRLRYEVGCPCYVAGNKMNSFDPPAISPVSGTPG